MSLEDRTITIRCHTRSPTNCWDNRKGRFTVVLPAFFANRGAKEYGEVVNRISAQVELPDQSFDLIGNKFWFMTSYGGKKSPEPFRPIVVPGGSSAGGELHFVPYKQEQFPVWADIADKIIEGRDQYDQCFYEC